MFDSPMWATMECSSLLRGSGGHAVHMESTKRRRRGERIKIVSYLKSHSTKHAKISISARAVMYCLVPLACLHAHRERDRIDWGQ